MSTCDMCWRAVALAGWLAALTGCASLQPTPSASSPAVAPTLAPEPQRALAEVVAATPPEVPSKIAHTKPEPAAIDASAQRAATPLKRLDPAADSERADLWQRLRNGFALPDLDGELVRKWEQYYSARPDYVARMTERGGRYLFHIVEEVERRGLPLELALLPFIESAFNPQALSRASASGMWQFMPATGRSFELKQNVFRDDRRDVLASTRAALDYLQRLHTRFGEWQLALAAYNWGQGNVNRALTENERRGKPREYQALRMPNETRDYVPKLQAMKNIVARPEAFGLALTPLQNHPYFLSVAIEHDIDVALAARLAGMTLEAFQQLNPQLSKPVILAAGTPQVLLPYDNANQFVQALAAHAGAMASWTAWRAPRTLKPGEAAKLVGMREDDLREVNVIPARMLVKSGSVLVVPRGGRDAGNVSEAIADSGMLALAPEARQQKKATGKGARSGKGGGSGKKQAVPAKPGQKQSPKAPAKPAPKKAAPNKSR